MTVPNVLTLLRILAVPFFAIAVWYGHHLEAVLLFAGAGITDLLDGWIARTFHQKSALGAILDPAADKLLTTTAFVLMTWRTDGMAAPVPVWVAILAISRDVLMSFTALAHMGNWRTDIFRPSFLGKVTTAVQLAALSFGLLANAMGPRPWTFMAFPYLYWLCAAFVLASGIHYFWRATTTPRPA
ncbi:MAG TPA: CDP-alcohol phosphatidyltransferase family protein [Holophagaceae bacterium]|nr:CDP-alcohol phosphatidyltransferase family protein [Holophagaceae bacterium]